MDLTRRELIHKGGAVLGSTLLAQHLFSYRLFARPAGLIDESVDHFFVLYKTFGGMDVTLGLDPYIMPVGADAEDMFIEYRPEEIMQEASLKLGPSAYALKEHANECSIINGVMMRRDAGHDVINMYMATGQGNGSAASVAAELGLALGQGPLGLIATNSAYLAGKSISLTTTADILESKESEKLIELVEEKMKLFPPKTGTPFEVAEKKLVEGKNSAKTLQELIKQYQKTYSDFSTRHIIAASFLSGASQQADMTNFGGLLDTHANHERTHLTEQKKIWEDVAALFKLFKQLPYKSGSLFDHTTFMVMSEFARTPALNGAKGKDHNPFTNSVLLAGKGIQTGKVFGASKLLTRKETETGYSEHIAAPYNYKEGKISETPEGASFIYPENVIQTIGKVFGSPAGFKPVSKNVPFIPGVAKL